MGAHTPGSYDETGVIMRGALRLGHILGIPVALNHTWLIAIALAAWSLASTYYPDRAPGFDRSTYWTMGVASAVLLLRGGVVSGIRSILIGRFLDTGAQSSYQQVVARHGLGEVRIGDIMSRDLHTVDPAMPVEHAIAEYFLPYKHGGSPWCLGTTWWAS